MYKNIIFDIGNVLLYYKPKEYLMKKIKDSNKVLEIYEQVFQSEEWLMLDKGTITEEEAKRIIIERNIINGEQIELAFENWYDLLTPIGGTVKVLNRLKDKGYRTYFLSNFHQLSFKHVTEKYDFFKFFDGGIVSYKEKLIKPDDNIYLRLLQEYNIKAEESIFIDDMQTNLDGASKFNIKTILFNDAEDLIKKLQECKITI